MLSDTRGFQERRERGGVRGEEGGCRELKVEKEKKRVTNEPSQEGGGEKMLLCGWMCCFLSGGFFFFLKNVLLIVSLDGGQDSSTPLENTDTHLTLERTIKGGGGSG